MKFDLNQCDSVCIECIKQYKKKHDLKSGQGKLFQLPCKGILKHEVLNESCVHLSKQEQDNAIMLMDPVVWAANTLDWHCLDPDGSVWARKNPQEYLEWKANHPGEDIFGKSRYHRPYQAIMLRCTSRRKVARIGRQCGKSDALCVAIAFNLFMKPGIPEQEGFKVVLVTPFQSQIELVFKRLIQLLKGNSYSANTIQRFVKSPNYALELHNGSTLAGFTAGSKSGNNADSVRGQTGNMLVLDEADYLSVEDFNTVMSVIANQPQALVWMSSTPQGKRERFYNSCFSPKYKEFYFPSTANPLWNEELEASFREALTALGYRKEVMAEFGDQEEGVFQTAYVQGARAKYLYKDMKRLPNWIYSMGVDWNDVQVGTSFVITGYDPIRNKLQVVHKEGVSREGWNQTAAIQKLRDLNRIWEPKYIYVDKGYGATQFEFIKDYGMKACSDPTKGAKHPDAHLRFVKQFDFGGTLEIRDPWTKQPVQKDAKPFLVESAVRRFESGGIVFPETDEALEKQLLGYIVKRVTSSGRPVYEAGNAQAGDHDLDALMLSIVAFDLESEMFGKPIYSSHISFAGYFGENKTSEIYPTGITGPEPKKENKQPPMNRTEVFQPLSITSSPIPARPNGAPQIKLWSWPGFLRDESAPTRKRIGGTTNKPKRRSF